MEDHANLSRAAASSEAEFAGLIGESAPMRRLYELIRKMSQSISPVLLLGETGTGKEMVARAIHFRGVRHEKALVPIDCSALTPTLVESELFGHVKGAFTGADQSKRGLLQAASGGTILLDEIGELPIFLQAKLLRALQEKEIRPVGSTERMSIDVRIISATNRDLEEAVRKGTFRQDLYFRMNIVQIRLPALRERKDDIPLLVTHFLKKFSDPCHPVSSISNEALQLLKGYNWPGNVRELENAVECAVALSSGRILTAEDLSSVPYVSGDNEIFNLKEIEHRAISHALNKTGGDKFAAARGLGIGKTTLYRKVKEYASAPTPATTVHK